MKSVGAVVGLIYILHVYVFPGVILILGPTAWARAVSTPLMPMLPPPSILGVAYHAAWAKSQPLAFSNDGFGCRFGGSAHAREGTHKRVMSSITVLRLGIYFHPSR